MRLHSSRMRTVRNGSRLLRGIPGPGGGGLPGPGGGGVCSRGVCSRGYLLRGVSAPGVVSQHALRQTPPHPRERRLLLRTVRILLECILVALWSVGGFSTSAVADPGFPRRALIHYLASFLPKTA